MMGALSSILRSVEAGRVGFWCPGCNLAHVIPVGKSHNPGANWGYNGNPEAPTFTPSILVRTGHYVPGHDGVQCYCTWDKRDQADFADLQCTICHSVVVDGKIQFLADCTHALSGQTVPIPPWPTGHEDGG